MAAAPLVPGLPVAGSVVFTVLCLWFVAYRRVRAQGREQEQALTTGTE